MPAPTASAPPERRGGAGSVIRGLSSATVRVATDRPGANLTTPPPRDLFERPPARAGLQVRALERRRAGGRAEHVVGASVRTLVGVVGGLDLEDILAITG